ncbi:hypothetical protein [Streptomyces sp. NPDC127084]|uniref:hypothetical protein n=1 Tax=Streptomyces sp. NPDC127084 TaxID=3347133 RepID=UPI00364E8C1D
MLTSARRRFAVMAGLCVILGWVAVAPTPVHARESMDDTEDSTDAEVVFEVVAAGGLSINPPDTALLSRTVPGGTARGTIGQVTVVDERAASDAEWTAIVSLNGPFRTGEGHRHQTIPGSRVWYDPGEEIDPVNGPFLPGTPGTIADPRVAFRHPSGSGGNSVTWDPTLEVEVPALAVAGWYRGVVTHSVA